MKTTFSWTLLLNITMIVFGLLARKRCGQKSPGSWNGEICQPRHALCWCVLWRIMKTAFHSREGKSKWETLTWKSVTQTGWKLKVSSAIWFHIPAEQSSKLDCRQLQWLRRKRRIATNSTDLKVSNLLTIMSEDPCVNATRHFNPSQIPSTSWRNSYNQCGTICHRTQVNKAIYTEHRQKTSSLCESWGRTRWTRL